MIIVFKFITSLIPWGILFLLKGSDTYHILNIEINNMIGITSSFLCILLPKYFDMGVNDWNESNIVDKLMPIAVCLIIIELISLIDKSYATVTLTSLLLGYIFPYIGKIIHGR